MSHEEKKRHGGPYDRGTADAWYKRPSVPHYFEGATYTSHRRGEGEMTSDEVALYEEGFSDGMASGKHKKW